MTEERLVAPTGPRGKRGSVNRALLAPVLDASRPSAPGAVKGLHGPISDNRGKRVIEGFLQKWSFSRKRFENWYIILWENKDMTLYEKNKPYNDRSSFKATLRINPMVGYLFYMTTTESPHCFQLVQEDRTYRFAGETTDRERFATVFLKMGIRMVTGPGGQEESSNFVNLMKVLPQLDEITKLARLPTMMQVVCVECDQRSAVVRCEQCEDLYCRTCFDSLHKSGKRATHTVQSIEPKKANAQEKTLVELYAEKLPFIIGDIIEHISTVEEVENYKPDKSVTPRSSKDQSGESRESLTMDSMEGVLDTGDPRRGLGRSVATRALHHQGKKKGKKEEAWVKVAPLGIKLTDEEQKDFRESMADTLREADDAFAQMVASFRECCEVKERSYHFTKYPNCFVGKHTVDALIKNGVVSSRCEAVELGNRLIEEDIIQHVAKEHSFEDAGLFYRFADAPLPRDSELVMVPRGSDVEDVRSTAPNLLRTTGRETKEPEQEKDKVFVCGDYVELFGLDTIAFNGQRGHVVTVFENSRYEVQLESGTVAKFRLLNMSKVVNMKPSLSMNAITSQSFKG
jgi:hypothetical protein